MKSIAAMCKAFLKIYEENTNLEKKLEQVQIDFPYEIEKRDKEICYLNSLLAKSITESALPANEVRPEPGNQQPEAPRVCELCGKPVPKPSYRFCSTSCQVKFSHRQRGHNTTEQPAPKRKYTHRKHDGIPPAPEPLPVPEPTTTEEKGPAPGK